jgi:subtilisin family serine protease
MENYPFELRHGSGAVMTLDPTRLLLAFKEPTPHEEVEARLREFDLVMENLQDTEREELARPFDFVNHTDHRFWVRSLTDQPIDQQRFDALYNKLADVLDWIGPVYRLGDAKERGGLLCPLPNVLLIKPVPQLTEPQQEELKKMLEGQGVLEVGEKSAYLGDYRYYTVSDTKERNAYHLQELLLQEEELISEARFENMPMVVPIAAIPNDTFFPQQWSMTRIRAGGAGTTGWDISTGAAGVVICILDSGCDLTHPDLNFAAGAIGQGINLGTMMPTGAPVGSPNVRGHGTCCAGLAAARFNNAAGVAGVAGNCSIMPVAFQNWTDVEVSAGINWAANNGASVISMSFGVYAPGDGFWPTGWDFALIDPAITNAVNVRGCVLVAATGNENTGVINRYPARDPLVIAVGGSDQADNRKDPASADGECWGASFGPGISVVAPCVLNPTTDIQGGIGYNVNNGGPRWVACVNYANCGDAAGNYFFQFNGTSSATPHVAGLAGAIRSQNPALTNLQVRDIIEQTADKVGGAYADVAGFPNGTRNTQMGYGRINMLRALEAANPLPAFQYAAKFVCGRSTGEAVAPGIYFTAVNVHNPTNEAVRFRKKVAVALPGERPGSVSEFSDAKLGPDQAFEIDCQDIRRHAQTREGFLKGFAVIESDVELDVVAVYTAAREVQVETIHTERVAPRKRREQRVGLPDLVPVRLPNMGMDPIAYCNLDDRKRLVVTVKNQGDAGAPASTTRVTFHSVPGGDVVVDLPTPALAAGESVDLDPIELPNCYHPNCHFTITVDVTGVVAESNEANNTAEGYCLG